MAGMSNFTWPVDWSKLPSDDSPEREYAVDAAVAVLWALTGRVYGLRAVEARPCPPSTVGAPGGAIPLAPSRGWEPVLHSGVVRNVSTVAVDCGKGSGILLPGPVASLIGWAVDGEEMNIAGLQLNGNTVLRTAGGGWPRQDLTLPSTEPGTFAIRYLQGAEPPAGAEYVVGVLAAEFYAAATGEGKCRLPRRTSQVQRQGVTVSVADPEEVINAGLTGIAEIDMWIRALNPYRLAQPTTVWSPDLSI